MFRRFYVVAFAPWVCILFFSSRIFGQDTSGYDIQLEVEGLEDTVAYLGFHFGDKRYLQDTAIMKDGKVSFEDEKEIKTGLYFLYTKSFLFEFVVEENELELKLSRSDSYKNLQANGSRANELYRSFQMIMVDHQTKIKGLTSALDSTSTKEDSLAAYDQIKQLNESNKIRRDSLEDAAGTSFVGQLLKMMELNPELRFRGDSLTLEQKREQYNLYRRTYFDELDFNSEGLLRSPIFHNKLMEYVNKVTFQNPDSIIVSIDELLQKSEGNEELYRYILRVMFQEYQNPKIMGMDKIFVYLSDKYYLSGKADWADEKMIKELREELVFHRDNQIGLKAPQIYYQDTTKTQSNLYVVNADYIILYFYSPTCGHCKKKTPVLLDVYHKLDGKAEVVAVCTDTEIPAWKKFIKDLNLDWLNYADPEYKSNFRVQYNVRSTPMLYVLDKDKIIIGKKLDVDQVEQFINDQIKLAELNKS